MPKVKKKTHGGKRDRAGRKAGTPTAVLSVRVAVSQITLAREIEASTGQNLSAFMRENLNDYCGLQKST